MTTKNPTGKVWWIVWNEAKNEGVIFDNKADAEWTAGEDVPMYAAPALGEEFQRLYDDDALTIEAVTLRPA